MSHPATTQSFVAPAATVQTQSTAKETIGQSVFKALNAARAKKGLPALRWSGLLQASARKHNLSMASRNSLSHQLNGEKSLGSRVSAQGIHWTYVAENIGWTTAMNRDGALAIQKAMLAEKAPNDGHRQNILSRSARSVGIDIVLDTKHHKLWLTQDFARS